MDDGDGQKEGNLGTSSSAASGKRVPDPEYKRSTVIKKAAGVTESPLPSKCIHPEYKRSTARKIAGVIKKKYCRSTAIKTAGVIKKKYCRSTAIKTAGVIKKKYCRSTAIKTTGVFKRRSRRSFDQASFDLCSLESPEASTVPRLTRSSVNNAAGVIENLEQDPKTAGVIKKKYCRFTGVLRRRSGRSFDQASFDLCSLESPEASTVPRLTRSSVNNAAGVIENLEQDPKVNCREFHD